MDVTDYGTSLNTLARKGTRHAVEPDVLLAAMSGLQPPAACVCPIAGEVGAVWALYCVVHRPRSLVRSRVPRCSHFVLTATRQRAIGRRVAVTGTSKHADIGQTRRPVRLPAIRIVDTASQKPRHHRCAPPSRMAKIRAGHKHDFFYPRTMARQRGRES